MGDRQSQERSSSEIATSPGAAAFSGPGSYGIDTANPRTSTEKSGHQKEADHTLRAYKNVVQSDIGVGTLLTRLKQSIVSARDFAGFLKKCSTIEEEHAQSLKKLAKGTFESARRSDSRQGSYSRNYEEITRIYDRMADNGIQFALSLHQMHEDLAELSLEKEKGRKLWKQNGLSAEKRVQDAEAAMEKAKIKYHSLAEDYDRARTGDKQPGRFGLKGPKSAAQVEEDLHRKMQVADADYSSKVQTAQSVKQELVNTLRPQAIKALETLINECDSGLTLQMQKFATFNERLLLGNGICISPLEEQGNTPQSARSLREVVNLIDNNHDLISFVNSFSSKVGSKQHEIEYKRHPTLQNTSSTQNTGGHSAAARQQDNGSTPQTLPSLPSMQSQQSQLHSTSYQGGPPPSFGAAPIASGLGHYADHTITSKQHQPTPSMGPLPTISGQSTGAGAYHRGPDAGHIGPGSSGKLVAPDPSTSVPSKPVFGVSLETLFQRDGSAVPMVVNQCLQAVDLFGLDVEGIYRLSGTVSHIGQLRALFDNDSTQVDFRNPENFMHDVNSVAGLLKQFFRDLPDPLLTNEQYQTFIDAARIDDDITRRDSLHETINNLPDPNYATLRALTLHLHRVQEHSSTNRMTSANLAICFGPTLMVSGSPPAIADAGWQVRVIDTILQNTFEIFDDD